MQKTCKKALKKVTALLLAFAMIASPVLDFGSLSTVHAADVTVQASGGYEEGAYVEWEPVAGANGYVVYTSKNGTDWTAIDDMLIRRYANYYRADAVGLTAGTWYLKVEAAVFTDGAKTATVAEKTVTVPVTSHDRTGFAWVKGKSASGATTASGAYNEDGSLKDGAVVLYITNETQNEVTADVVTSSKGAVTSCVGVMEIMLALKKGYETRPYDFRLIGDIRDADGLDNASEFKGDWCIETANKTFGVTVEGIGKDAVANGWGLRLKSASNVEVRNIAFMNCNSGEGDDVGLQQKNDHIWVHNCDFFYGDAGKDADQVKGDGALDTKKSTYVTMSYNHFWDCGKCNLLGLSEGNTTDYFITYHHNWYDHSDSRHPRTRFYSAHIYNNYYDGNAKYGAGSTLGSSVFMDSNYFRNCQYPMLTSLQGSDVFAGGTARDVTNNATFSKEAGGTIKAYGNVMVGDCTFIPYGCTEYILKGSPTAYNLAGTTSEQDFDAYVVENRGDTVPAKVVSYSGGNTYNNFDTDSSLMYDLTGKVDTAEVAKEKVLAHAGRVQQGDFVYSFEGKTYTQGKGADQKIVDADRAYVVDTELKAALASYQSSIVSIGGSGVVVAPAEYTVIYKVGDTEVKTETVIAGHRATAPETPAIPDGYKEFGGWYDGAAKWNFNLGVKKNMTLTAKFLTEAEAGGGGGNGGSGGGSGSGSGSVSGEEDKASTTGEITPIGDNIVIYNAVNLEAGNMSTAHFLVNKDKATSSGTSVEYEGLQFSGKPLNFTADGSTVQFKLSKKSRVIIYLRPTLGTDKSVKITGGGFSGGNVNLTATGILDKELTAGDITLKKNTQTEIYAIVVIPEGATSGGGSTGGEEEEDDPEEETVYYTVTFDRDNGSANIKKTVEEGDPIMEEDIATPSKDGAVFAGWYDEADQKVIFPYVPTKSEVLKAKWLTGVQGKYELIAANLSKGDIREKTTINGFTIHVEDGNRTIDGDDVKLYMSVNDGYLGTNGLRLDKNAYEGAEDDMLKAIEFTAEKEGTLYVEAAVSSKNKTSYLVLDVAKEEGSGYTNVDKKTLNSSSKKSFEFAIPGAGTYYLYPTGEKGLRYWSLKLDEKVEIILPQDVKYTITVDKADGSVERTFQVTEGASVTATMLSSETPTREGYTFKHWKIEGTDTPVTFPVTPTGDMKFIAVWEEGGSSTQPGTKYNITVDKADGSTATSFKVTAGESVTEAMLSAETPTREGYTFKHWKIEGSDTPATFPVMPTGDMKFIAVWEESGSVTPPPADVKYTITVDKADGSEATSFQVTAGESVTEAMLSAEAPTRENYTFKYWIIEGTDTPVTFPVTPTGDMKFVAVWEKNETDIPPVGHGIAIIGLEESYEYTGAKVVPDIYVIDYDNGGGKLLELGIDYTVTYANNTAVNYRKDADTWMDPKKIPTVTIVGKGNYIGKELQGSFEIRPVTALSDEELADLTGIKFNKIAEVAYTGNRVYPNLVRVNKDKSTTTFSYDPATRKYSNVENPEDILGANVAFANNKNAGTATILLTGKKNGKGKNTTFKTTFKISPVDLSKATAEELVITATPGVYNVKGTAPDSLKVVYKGAVLAAGKDYTVKYSKNTAVTENAQVSITGKGNYAKKVDAGKIASTYKIEALNLNATEVIALNAAEGMAASKVAAIVPDLCGNVLKANQYTLSVRVNGTPASELEKNTKLKEGDVVTVTAAASEKQANVTGVTPEATFTVGKNFSKVKAEIVKVSVEGKKAPQTKTWDYTGGPIILTGDDLKVTMKVGKETKTLVCGTDYEIVKNGYTGNVNKGTATVTIVGKGEYSGYKAVKFKIVAKKMK